MTTTVWYRESKDEQYRPASPFHENIDESRAHRFADRKNVKHDYGMWWVGQDRPSTDKVPKGF